MKRKSYFSILSVLVLSVFVMTGCNMNRDRSDQTDEMGQTDREEELQELRADLRDTREEINDLLQEEEPDNFQNEANRLINDFQQKLEDYEDNLEETGEDIEYQTRQAIDNVKNQADQLEQRLEEMDEADDAEQNWDQVREELRRDFQQLGQSIENFFQDNV